MIALLLCLSAVILCSSGSPIPGEDIQCPALPCPLPPCADPHPTYYIYHGKVCQGCSQCDTAASRPTRQAHDVRCPYLPCPFLPCPENDTYTTYYIHQGVLCEGCKQCRDRTTPPQCPIVDCAFPESCRSGNVQISTIQFQGHECPGCPICA